LLCSRLIPQQRQFSEFHDVRALELSISPIERMEQSLFDLLHLLSAADAAVLALVEHALDPDGTPAQFFAASHVRHELQQARAVIVSAQQQLAHTFAAVPALTCEPTEALVT
jgi:hypothetical protein